MFSQNDLPECVPFSRRYIKFWSIIVILITLMSRCNNKVSEEGLAKVKVYPSLLRLNPFYRISVSGSNSFHTGYFCFTLY